MPRKSIALYGSAMLLALIAPGSPLAQTQEAPPPDPANVAFTKAGGATVAYLQKRFNIDQGEAEKRFRLQSEIAILRRRLSTSLASSFVRIRVIHSPAYRVVVETTDVAGTNAGLGELSPELRAALQVSAVSRSAADITGRADELSNLLRSGRFANSVGFNPETDKFVVTVENQEALALAGTLLSTALRQDVSTVIGRVPVDSQAGYAPGDYTYGGWALHNASNAYMCTSGYVVRLSDARYGVTTAGHCDAADNRIYVNGKFVTLAGTTIRYNGGLYDYRVHLTGSLSIWGHVAYRNNLAVRHYPNLINYVPGYANQGYLRVKDTAYIYGAGQDDIVCKSGETTWLTCGQVVNTYLNYTSKDGVTRNGMHEVSYFYERVPGFQGDSGAPVFREEPDGTIMPAGTFSSSKRGANNGPCDTQIDFTCSITYMPIDRINDQQPMQIKTDTGTAQP